MSDDWEAKAYEHEAKRPANPLPKFVDREEALHQILLAAASRELDGPEYHLVVHLRHEVARIEREYPQGAITNAELVHKCKQLGFITEKGDVRKMPMTRDGKAIFHESQIWVNDPEFATPQYASGGRVVGDQWYWYSRVSPLSLCFSSEEAALEARKAYTHKVEWHGGGTAFWGTEAECMTFDFNPIAARVVKL